MIVTVGGEARRDTGSGHLQLLTDAHQLLIDACTVDSAEFVPALERILDEIGLDQLDDAGLQLLPLVFRRLLDSGVSHPARRQLNYFYRATWSRNHLLVHRARDLFAELTDRGVTPVVLKGAALVSSAYFDDLGVRPMADIDILLPPDVAEPITRWALEAGWRLAKNERLDDAFAAHHAVDLVHGEDGAVDVHWSLLVNSRDERRDAELIACSRPANLGDVAVRVLSPTHQLLHTTAHVKPVGVRHLVDAITVIRDDPSAIDWEGLVDDVIARRVVANTVRTLELVDSAAPGIVPAAPLQRLRATERHWSDYVFQGEALESRGAVIRRFAADVASRARGTGPVGHLRTARAVAGRYSRDADTSVGQVVRDFVRRGADAIDAETTEPG